MGLRRVAPGLRADALQSIVKLARRQVAKTWKVHSRSLEYTDELPASWQRARDAASSILNLRASTATLSSSVAAPLARIGLTPLAVLPRTRRDIDLDAIAAKNMVDWSRSPPCKLRQRTQKSEI